MTCEDLELAPAPSVRFSAARMGASGGMYVRTAPQDSQSVELAVFGGDGSDVDEATRRRIERTYYREEFRRAFGQEMGELRYPPRAVEHYAVALVHSLDDAVVRHRSFKVVIDAGGGTASLVLPHLLSRLSLDSLIVNGHLDENRVAPTEGERQADLDRLARLVTASGADLGVLFDAVGERIVLVDERGAIVGLDRALLLYVDLIVRTKGTAASPCPSPPPAWRPSWSPATAARSTGASCRPAPSCAPPSATGWCSPAPRAEATCSRCCTPPTTACSRSASCWSSWPSTTPPSGPPSTPCPSRRWSAAGSRPPGSARARSCARSWRRPRAAASTTPTGSRSSTRQPGRGVRGTGGVAVERAGAGPWGDDWALVIPDTVEPVTHLWAEAGDDRRHRPGRRVRDPHPPGRRAGVGTGGQGRSPWAARVLPGCPDRAAMGLPEALAVGSRSPGPFPRSRPVSRRPARPDGMPKEPTISVADPPAEPQDHRSSPPAARFELAQPDPSARPRRVPERLAAALRPLGRGRPPRVGCRGWSWPGWSWSSWPRGWWPCRS